MGLFLQPISWATASDARASLLRRTEGCTALLRALARCGKRCATNLLTFILDDKEGIRGCSAPHVTADDSYRSLDGASLTFVRFSSWNRAGGLRWGLPQSAPHGRTDRDRAVSPSTRRREHRREASWLRAAKTHHCDERADNSHKQVCAPSSAQGLGPVLYIYTLYKNFIPDAREIFSDPGACVKAWNLSRRCGGQHFDRAFGARRSAAPSVYI